MYDLYVLLVSGTHHITARTHTRARARGHTRTPTPMKATRRPGPAESCEVANAVGR